MNGRCKGTNKVLYVGGEGKTERLDFLLLTRARILVLPDFLPRMRAAPWLSRTAVWQAAASARYEYVGVWGSVISRPPETLYLVRSQDPQAWAPPALGSGCRRMGGRKLGFIEPSSGTNGGLFVSRSVVLRGVDEDWAWMLGIWWWGSASGGEVYEYTCRYPLATDAIRGTAWDEGDEGSGG